MTSKSTTSKSKSITRKSYCQKIQNITSKGGWKNFHVYKRMNSQNLLLDCRPLKYDKSGKPTLPLYITNPTRQSMEINSF